jgi:hypothetical protein
MKTKLVAIVLCLLTVYSVNAIEKPNLIQEKKVVKIKGVFDGYDEEDGFAFLVKSDTEEGEQTIYLQTISNEALKMINLKSKEMEGKRFEVTCELTEIEEKDEFGQVEIYESYHIISIKKS